MDDVRLVRLLAGTLVVLGGLGGLLALSIGALAFGAFFAACIVAGTVGYRIAPRCSSVLDVDAPVDPASTRTIVASLVKLGVFCLAFAVLGYVCFDVGLASPASVPVLPPTLALVLLGATPGVFLGAGLPTLARREIVFHRFDDSFAGQVAGNALTLGTYPLVLLVAPAAVGGFVGAYVVSRLTVLVGWWVASRR